MTIKEIELTYEEMSKEIHYINERLVLLLNDLEETFSFSPFENENDEYSGSVVKTKI